MKIRYDQKADAISIKFQEGKYSVSKEVAEGIIMDLTKNGKIMAIEILDVSKRMPKTSIENISVMIPYSV